MGRTFYIFIGFDFWRHCSLLVLYAPSHFISFKVLVLWCHCSLLYAPDNILHFYLAPTCSLPPDPFPLAPPRIFNLGFSSILAQNWCTENWHKIDALKNSLLARKQYLSHLPGGHSRIDLTFGKFSVSLPFLAALAALYLPLVVGVGVSPTLEFAHK